MLDLIAGADVVVQNFRPGVVDRLGLGYEAARARRAGIVYVSISGYGPDGPHAHRPIYDPIIQALVGIVARQQSEAVPLPDLVRNVMIDKATALTAAQAICAALVRSARTGEGDHLVIPMLDVGLYFFWPDGMADFTFVGDGVEPGPRARRLRVDPLHRRPTGALRGDRRCTSSVFRVIGHPELSDEPQYNGTANAKGSILSKSGSTSPASLRRRSPR